MKISKLAEEHKPTTYAVGEHGRVRVMRRQSKASFRRLVLAKSSKWCYCSVAAHLTWYYMSGQAASGNCTAEAAEISSFKKASRINAVKKTSRRYFVKKIRGASYKTSSGRHAIKRMWRSNFFGKSPRRDTFKKFIAALRSEELVTVYHWPFELKGVTNDMKPADDAGSNGLFPIQKHVRVESGEIAEIRVEVKTLIERVGSFCVGGINVETGGTEFLLFNSFVRTNGNVIISHRLENREQLCLKAFTSR